MMRLHRYLLVGLILLVVAARADDPFTDDDHGDSAAGATAVTFGSQAGVIEIDTDRDFFQFVAQPGREYGIAVMPGTLKDATVRLRSSDGLYTVATAHSVGDTQTTLVFPHAAGAATVPLEVCGFAKYTTGSYSLTVTDQAIVDSDGDGMADAWETAFFTNLAQTATGDLDGDGLHNRDEYELGYDPTDIESRFSVTEAEVAGQPRTLHWVSAPFRTYDVQAAGAMTASNWVTIGTVPGTNTTASFSDASGAGEIVRFWRIAVR